MNIQRRYEDAFLECRDCGERFVWTGGEQRFYERKALAPPKRCARCRDDARELRRTLNMGGSRGSSVLMAS
jgi:hypothetical protein